MYVVTLPASAAQNPLPYAERAKEHGADVLEIRGDLTPTVQEFDSPLPILLALRGTDEELVERLQPEYVDLELEESCKLQAVSCKLIRSYHNYDQTPPLSELEEIATRLSVDSDMIKIAVRVNTFADLQTLKQLQESLPSEQKSIVLGMGPKAHLNRLLSPYSNELTYTFIEDESHAAPGQIPLLIYKSLLSLPPIPSRPSSELRMIEGGLPPPSGEGWGGGKPKILGLLGSPDIQSFGPVLHNTLYKNRGINAVYSLFLTENLENAWEHLTALGVEGFSVTAPFKQEIIPYLDKLSDDAKLLGTVNTVVKKDGQWIGYPRDAEGLVRGYLCLRESKSAAIIGSGGVVPSVIHACHLSGIKNITIYARNEQARTELAKKFNCNHAPLDNVQNDQSDVLIYAISKNINLPLPSPCHPELDEGPSPKYAIDLRYGKETLFMKSAAQNGYTVHDGLPMFIHQALAQAELFTGLQANESDVKLFYDLLSP